jgi:anti-sigma factor RsiW
MNDDRISAYLDGVLDGAELDAFEHRLQSDPSLVDDVAVIAAVRSTLRSLPWSEPPDGFDDRMLAVGDAVDAERVVARLRLRRWAAVGAAAAAVSLAVVVGDDADRSPVQPAIDEAGDGHVINAGLADDPIMLLAPSAGSQP